MDILVVHHVFMMSTVRSDYNRCSLMAQGNSCRHRCKKGRRKDVTLVYSSQESGMPGC